MFHGFRPRNHPNQVARDGARDDVDDRWTPQDFFDAMHAEHGFTVDVAAARHNAKLKRFYSKWRSGLKASWRDEVVWCNPPYSDLDPWVAKATEETVYGGCRKVVMLLPANRCEQAFWQRYIEPVRDRGLGVSVRFIARRLRFGNTGVTRGSNVPFGSVVVIFEPPPRGRRRGQAAGSRAKSSRRRRPRRGAR